jgi:hypothetical protein
MMSVSLYNCGHCKLPQLVGQQCHCRTPEDEAFDELARKQGMWGGGFPAKRAMAADKLQEPDELEALKYAASKGYGHIVRENSAPFTIKEAMAADKLQEPAGERAWFTIAELNAWADKKLAENPQWVMPTDEPEQEALAQPAQEQCQKHGECFGGECIYPPAQEPVVQPAPGYCKNCKDYTIEEPLYAQPAQEPVAFAGIEIWVGGARITKHLTQTELHYAQDPWMLLQYSAEWCLAKLKEKTSD